MSDTVADARSVMASQDDALWYALRTRSRHEKTVRDHLAGWGVEPFLPLWVRRSRWKDRWKEVATPLFPGYCFARFPLLVKREVLKTPGVVQIVGRNGTPEPVRPAELEGVRRLVEGPLRYDPCPFVTEGAEVEIVRGPLAGIRGRLLVKDTRARVAIGVHLISRGAVVVLDAGDVAPV